MAFGTNFFIQPMIVLDLQWLLPVRFLISKILHFCMKDKAT
jgi:hypothetical protein